MRRKKRNAKAVMKENINEKSVVALEPTGDEALDDVLQGLPVEKRAVIMQSISFKGPLPPPAVLAQYNQIDPGFAERIFQMAEMEQKNRHKNETKIVESQTKIAIRGQLISGCIVVLMVCVAILFAFTGFVYLAGIILTTTLVGAISKFLTPKAKDIDSEDKKDIE